MLFLTQHAFPTGLWNYHPTECALLSCIGRSEKNGTARHVFPYLSCHTCVVIVWWEHCTLQCGYSRPHNSPLNWALLSCCCRALIMKVARGLHKWKFIKRAGWWQPCVLWKLGRCISLYKGTMERCHIGSRSWPLCVEKLRNIFVTKSANKHPHMQQFTAFCKTRTVQCALRGSGGLGAEQGSVGVRRQSDLIFIREAPFTMKLMMVPDSMYAVWCCVAGVYDWSWDSWPGDCSPHICTQISSQCSATL